MPRNRQRCKVQVPPKIKGFIPRGYFSSEKEDSVVLHLDEYEAIRLLDYEGLSQLEAAGYMEVSRPTLTRIYERARKKIATAMTEAREIIIEGGRVVFNGEWYACRNCSSTFNVIDDMVPLVCPLCECADIFILDNSNE